MFNRYTNLQNNERYALLGLTGAESEDCKRFSDLDYTTMCELMEKGYLDPTDTQNFAPSAGEIKDFLATHRNFTAHGYIINNDRADRRISIEGVEGIANTAEELEQFTDLFSGADEFTATLDGCYCWFD